jgi:HK97 gp10 family phage protein
MITAKLYIDISPLEGLRKTLVSKILRKAVTEASKIVKQTVASNASSIKRFGFLAKSIGVKIKTYSEKKSAVAIVGPRSKWFKEIAGRKYRPSYYAHLLEGGTKRSRQKPFLKPAFDSTKDQYLTTLANAIERGIATQLNAQKTK